MRDPYVQLRRIQEAIAKIMGYTKKGRESFDTEEEIRLSIIFYLQLIDRAAHTISHDFKDHHPEIPWEQLRDIDTLLVPYSIEPERDVVWKIAAHDLPFLKPKIDAMLAQKSRVDEYRGNQGSVDKTKKAAVLRELLRASREDILRIAAKHGASNVRVFGSVARGEADSESDIDLLVNMEPDRSLLDLAELLADLQKLLGHRLDVVTEEGLNEEMREQVLRETVTL